MASQSVSHSSSLSTMDREMCSLLVELASDKVTVRQKSFNRMSTILQNREEVFLNYMASDSFDTRWDVILDAIFQGMEKQSYGNSAHVQSKNHDYVMVLIKLVELAVGRDEQHLSHSQLVRYFVRAINDQAMRECFGQCFLKMLKEFVLGTSWCLTTVSYEQWKEIIDGCFVMLDSYREHKQVVLNSLSLAVEKFLSNCSRYTLLAEYLNRLLGLLHDAVVENKSIILCDLIKIALNIAQALAVDCKTKVIEFLESIDPYMLKIYKAANLRIEQKATLFRLMHLSLIILYPGGKSYTQTKALTKARSVEAAAQLVEGDDETRRRKMLREYHYIMVSEMNLRVQNAPSKGPQATVPLADGFIDFAARLCYTVYWNEDHGGHDESHSAKRNKEFNKLQSIMEMVGTAPNHYNLRWLLILAAVLDRYESALAAENCLPLLQLLCNVQPNLQTPVEHDAFYQCCSVLLKFEQKPSPHHHRSSDADSMFSELWSKMIAAAFCTCANSAARPSTTNSSSLLLQLLIRHRKYPNVSFLNNTVLESFYTYAVKKTNLNVGTILAILETVGSIERLGSVNDVLGKLFNYLYPQTRETASKEILHANERLTAKTLAQISVLCVVTTRPTTTGSPATDGEQRSAGKRERSFYQERDRQLQTMEQRLRHHDLEELLALEERKQQAEGVGHPGTEGSNISYNINEPLFKRLLEIISFDSHQLPAGNDFLVDALIRVCEDLELYLNIINILLHHGAYGERQFKRSPLFKKAQIKFEILNGGFERLLPINSSLTLVETKRLTERVLALFRGPYHPVVKESMSVTQHAMIIQWVMKRIGLEKGKDSAYVKVLQANELSTAEEQLQRCFYNIVAEYLQYTSGPCTEEIHQLLAEKELNVYSSLDLFYLFDLCRILLGQSPHQAVAEWVMQHFIDVCKAHHTDPDIAEQLIDLYGAFTLYMVPFEDQTRNVTILLHSFVRQCAKHTYSTELQVKIYAQIRYLLRAYPEHVQLHKEIYYGLVPLLGSQSYPIQLEVVVNMLYFMKLDWSHTDLTLVPGSFYEFQSELYELIKFGELGADGGTDVDAKTNVISCCLQLLLGIFRVNYMLRRRALCDFVLLIQAGKLNTDKMSDITRLVRASSGIDCSKLLQANLDTVLEQWLRKGYRLLNFPYRIAGKLSTIDEFVQLYKKNISFVILCMQPEQFEQFCQSIAVKKADVLKSILPKCYAFLLPMYAKCEGLSAKYMAMATRMDKTLAPFLRTVDLKDYVSDIIKHLTLRVNDPEELGKLLDQELSSCFAADLSISRATYSISIEHLKQSVWASVSFKYTLLSNLCLKNASPIQRTLTEVKRWLWAAEEPEQKSVHLLQYTILVDHVKEYLAQQRERSFKPYLVRDVVYFLCNLLASVPALRLATLNGLGAFLNDVVAAGDASERLAEHLQFIVSSLLEVESIDPPSQIAHKARTLLRFLILQHTATFGGAIGKLNYLPKDERFDQLRLAVSRHKTSGQENAPLREEIVAIIELPNLKYEDLVALKILLTTKKNDLKLLCDELGERSVSSAAHSENVLHRLVHTLLEVVRSSPFDKRSTEALRCLGEIGPIDLGAMLLKTDTEMIAYDTINNSKEAVERCADLLLSELNTLLTSRNITVGNLASQICYKMLYGKTFHTLAAKHPTLYPFLGGSAEETKLFTVSAGRKLSLSATITNERVTYHAFVQQLVAALLLFLDNTMLKKLVEQETSFAEKIIPLLVQITIKQFNESICSSIGCFINAFFGRFVAARDAPGNICSDPKAIQLLLTVVECVRIHNQLFPQFKIALNYLPIAQASQFCQAHFKAILYGELWYREDQEQQANGQAKRHPELLSVLKDCHLAIGVEDAVKSFLNPTLEREEYYRLEQHHTQCLVMQDASALWQRDIGGSVSHDAIMQTLKDLSAYGLARSLSSTPEQIDYECAWRLSDWNVLVDTVDPPKEGAASGTNGLLQQSRSFERAHYRALKCLKLRDEHAADDAIAEAQRAISELFKLTSIESTKHIYHGLCRLRMLQQIEDFGEVHFGKHIDCEQELLTKWAEQDELPHSEFALLETILSQRLAILSTAAGSRETQQWVSSSVHNTLLLLIHESRLRGLVNCAVRNVVLIEQETLPANVHSVVMLENAQLNWTAGQREVARGLAHNVMTSSKYTDVMVKGVACRLYGEFMAEEHMQEIKLVITDYLQQSVNCVQFAMARQQQEGVGERKTSSVPVNHRCFEQDRNCIALYTIAKYADLEFVRLTKHLRSQEWEARKQNLARMEQELARLKEEMQRVTDPRRKELARSLHFMQKNLQRDKKMAEEIEKNRSDYLVLSLCYYLMYAKQSTIESDMVIFRITSLWLNNLDDAEAVKSLEEYLATIPSHKFIAVLPQLTPRVGLDRSVGTLVQRVLIRCAQDHPHHTLPFVFAQLHAYKDQPDHETPTNDNRLMGVREVYKKLRHEPALERMLQQTERMNLALIELANKTLTSNPPFREYTMTKRDQLVLLENLDQIHCPTVELPVLAAGHYRTRTVGIKRWDAKVIGVGGINAPKKMTCLCLDGTKRTQLLKGKDDMRQDAVMQQVFGIMNVLLRHDKETAHRKLSVRTYKVVPLSRQSGILEWCNNTEPIGVWLATGHTKYRPQDIEPSVARKRFSNNALAGMTLPRKQANYEEICDKIRPVFRHYFLEHYLKPGVWFERQQNYTKSVAASSMIGYVLGIGDRHVQNLLIDKLTGEVIHIDFGIAFELGKNLPTPETIPFRLTRDIVDGMGVSGVEGVFRRSCEKTLEVLRKNHTVIIAILDVLLYDPLYSWNVLSNKKANRRQQQAAFLGDGEEEEDDYGGDGAAMMGLPSMANINVTAERALMQVEEKLLGQEENRYISVEGQVKTLIFNAMNESNLCQLFAGWQPYL